MRKRKAEILPVRIYGDRSLRKIAEPVDKITDEIKDFIANLTFTMYEKDGVGLAAPQVGRLLRIFVVDPFWFNEENEKNPVVLINPKFLEFEGQTQSEEGCLSFPDIYEKVMRAKKVVIESLNEKGKKVHYEADELFARVLQHEYDHLDGILFIDKMPKLRRMFLKKRLNDLESTTSKDGVNIG
ncbi:MAG: peptide deformylase [Candidatus Cloacimonetes bacterium]|nr:peptide deformylase [Candidatus Cloacimonadota bacterium]